MFSQLQNAPLLLNPALTGMMDGNHRLSFQLRNQTSQILLGDDYAAASLSYDARIALKNRSYIGLGISSFADVSGAVDYGTEQFRYLGSYIIPIQTRSGACHVLSAGLELGITQRKVDLTNRRWYSQYGQDRFFSGPPFYDTEFLHGEIGVGVNWKSFMHNDNTIQVGFAIHHLNRADVSFLNGLGKLNRRMTAHAQAEFPINNKLAVSYSFLFFSQGDQKLYYIGASGKWYFEEGRKNKSLELGAMYVNGNTLESGFHPKRYIFNTKVHIRKFQLGFSYDIAPSRFNNGTVVDSKAWEVFVQYTFNNTSSFLCTNDASDNE